MTFSGLWSTKEDHLKITFILWTKTLNILHNIFFCVLKKKSHGFGTTTLDDCMTEFPFWVNYTFKTPQF